MYCPCRGCSLSYIIHIYYIYIGLASSRDKKEDPIDRAVIAHMDEKFGHDRAISRVAEYTRIRSVGFNPVYKRVLFEYTHPIYGRICVSKGIPNKVRVLYIVVHIHCIFIIVLAYIFCLTLV